MLKVYLLLLALYTILTPLQFSAAVKQKHPIARLLTAALISEYVAILLTSFHYGLFAINGVGIKAFNALGDVMEIFAQVKSYFLFSPRNNFMKWLGRYTFDHCISDL